MKGSTTTWGQIRASLVERGYMTSDAVTRKAKARYCAKCNAAIIAGLDHERSAMAVYCDCVPLNRAGEATMLLAGRATYSLHRLFDRYELNARDSWHITGSPAGSKPDVEILAAHRCGAPPIPAALTGPSMVRPVATFGDDLDQPPF